MLNPGKVRYLKHPCPFNMGPPKLVCIQHLDAKNLPHLLGVSLNSLDGNCVICNREQMKTYNYSHILCCLNFKWLQLTFCVTIFELQTSEQKLTIWSHGSNHLTEQFHTESKTFSIILCNTFIIIIANNSSRLIVFLKGSCCRKHSLIIITF